MNARGATAVGPAWPLRACHSAGAPVLLQASGLDQGGHTVEFWGWGQGLLKRERVTLLKIFQWLSISLRGKSKVLSVAYKVLEDVASVTSLISFPLLPSHLHLLCFIHTYLLTSLTTRQAQPCLRAFALAVPLPGTPFPQSPHNLLLP